MIAWFAEAQARLTVNACTPFGQHGQQRDFARDVRRDDGRHDGAEDERLDLSVASRLVRWISSATQRLPSSIAEMYLSAVPARANGVRTPATIATRRPLPANDMAGS